MRMAPDPTVVQQYWQGSVDAFIKAIREESDPEALRGFLEGFQKVRGGARACGHAPAPPVSVSAADP
jgi:hypothetical protein